MDMDSFRAKAKRDGERELRAMHEALPPNDPMKQMDLMGQITALLKIEMHITAERMMLEAELAKLKEESNAK